jgi:hypothetical protein
MYTKIIYTLAIACLLFTSCQKKNYEVDNYLNKQEQLSVKMQLSKYMDRLPSGADMDDRWTGKADKYYHLKADSMHLLRYYIADDGYNYFYITRIVPSIHEGERRATAGRFKLKGQDSIVDLEEFFLSNILSEEKLIESANELFEEAVEEQKIETKSLLPLIEWPNDYFAYDKKRNVWDRRIFIKDSTQIQQ